jgi:hypothetical protein
MARVEVVTIYDIPDDVHPSARGELGRQLAAQKGPQEIKLWSPGAAQLVSPRVHSVTVTRTERYT